MKISISNEIHEQFQRVKDLAEEASLDVEETFSSRASAMSALSGVIRDLVKMEEKVRNMERLQLIEKIVIECVNEFLDDEEKEEFLNRLEERLEKVEDLDDDKVDIEESTGSGTGEGMVDSVDNDEDKDIEANFTILS